MGMSVTTGGGVKSEPNVVPMIDVMLVLLIIFMVVTPALMAGFNANPPQAVNLKDHPEDENLDQVHTEQLLCAQLDAFLDTLKANARQCGIVNVHGRWAFKKDVDQKGFDFGKLSINTRIVFEHVDGNDRTDCAACSTTIKNLTTKWGGVCKAFDVAVTKGS